MTSIVIKVDPAYKNSILGDHLRQIAKEFKARYSPDDIKFYIANRAGEFGITDTDILYSDILTMNASLMPYFDKNLYHFTIHLFNCFIGFFDIDFWSFDDIYEDIPEDAIKTRLKIYKYRVSAE